jgi:Leucine-rich repeat (LRR) protein
VLLPIIDDTLVVLDIHDNLLQKLPDALCRCRALEELNVSENPLLSAPTWLGDLMELRVVLLDQCGLRSLPSSMISAQHLHTVCSEFTDS